LEEDPNIFLMGMLLRMCHMRNGSWRGRGKMWAS